MKNTTPKYAEQYQKITSAYMKNQLNPWNECACFIGNLLNNKGEWSRGRDVHTGTICDDPLAKNSILQSENCVRVESNGFYTYQEVLDMENNFLRVIGSGRIAHMDKKDIDENLLFKAMESTLDMLRKLHESKGEIVDNYLFTRRVLAEV